jgi:hypothetical protein
MTVKLKLELVTLAIIGDLLVLIRHAQGHPFPGYATLRVFYPKVVTEIRMSYMVGSM